MISARELSLMKPTALLINTSRGPIVNEQDLADALNQGVIAGAAVDVYSVEPAELSNPVFTDRMAVQCAKGCLAVCRGEEWPDVVDRSAYQHHK